MRQASRRSAALKAARTILIGYTRVKKPAL